MSFYTGTQCELLYSLATPVTNTAFTTQRVVSAPATSPRAVIPAGFFSAVPNGVGRGLLVKAAGTVANQATAATFANVLGWDPTPGTLGSTVLSTPALAPTASTICPWNLECLITCQAVGNGGLTLQCNGEWRQSVVATGAALSASNLNAHFTTNLTALNSEAQAAIELWSTCSASGTSVIVVQQFDVLGLN